jgi:aminomethyltransferase
MKLHHTPLYAKHIANNARMVPFHGWEMPLHYGSQLEEHNAVRSQSGVFDVSHMTIVDVLGAGTRQFLRRILTHDVDKLQHTGRALYSPMCNERGGIIDDLIAYQRAPDNYRLVLNSATKEHDLAWLRQQIDGFSAGLQERHDLAILAVQGPQAIPIMLNILNAAQSDAISTLARFECVDVAQWFFARTGYTGEDGLEIIVPREKVEALWDNIINAGIKPCGLAARDTLRLEAGMLLYGQDMDETTSPLESGLAWTVTWAPQERDFIGMGAMLSQKQFGVKRKLVGLTLSEKAVMRAGQRVFVNHTPVGVITSGTYSPTLGHSIALARIPTDLEGDLSVEIRDKLYPVSVGKPRFYPVNTDKDAS